MASSAINPAKYPRRIRYAIEDLASTKVTRRLILSRNQDRGEHSIFRYDPLRAVVAVDRVRPIFAIIRGVEGRVCQFANVEGAGDERGHRWRWGPFRFRGIWGFAGMVGAGAGVIVLLAVVCAFYVLFCPGAVGLFCGFSIFAAFRLRWPG